MDGTMEGMRDEREAWGKCNTIVFGGGETKERKIK